MKILKNKYLPTVFLIVTFLFIILTSFFVPKETINELIKSSGNWGILILIFCLWIANVIAPLSGSPFLFGGFYAYGRMSVVYAFIAAVIASVTNFWIGKIWGRKLVSKLAGEENLIKLDELSKEYGLQTLFVFRLFMKEFHDVISYAFGLTNLSFKSYFVVSTLGMIPATIIWYLISLKITDPITFTTVSWIFAYVSGGVYILWLKFKKKR